MSAAPICNKKVSLYCRQKMNVAREAIVLNSQHERTDSWNSCIVRLLFIRSTHIVMLLYPAGMCRDTYILPHLPRSCLHICKWPWTVQWNVLGHTAASKCEGLTMFQALTLSTIFQGVAVGLVEPKLTRYQQYPEHGDGDSAWNVGRSSYLGDLPANTSLNSVAAKASGHEPV